MEIDWNSLDKRSRLLAKDLLEKFGYTVEETKGNCYLDLILKKENVLYGFEIKDRNF